MVIIPDSMATAARLTFTVGQVTWTTGVKQLSRHNHRGDVGFAYIDHDFANTDIGPHHTNITSPTPSLAGRRINNTDLLNSIDQIGSDHVETLALVDSI